jgi:hypothetical protein
MNWFNAIAHVMEYTKESWDDVESCTLTKEELLVEFDGGYGCTEGEPFTLWTRNFIYFPAQYDGAEWVAYVSRNPNSESTYHVGGG